MSTPVIDAVQRLEQSLNRLHSALNSVQCWSRDWMILQFTGAGETNAFFYMAELRTKYGDDFFDRIAWLEGYEQDLDALLWRNPGRVATAASQAQVALREIGSRLGEFSGIQPAANERHFGPIVTRISDWYPRTPAAEKEIAKLSLFELERIILGFAQELASAKEAWSLDYNRPAIFAGWGESQPKDIADAPIAPEMIPDGGGGAPKLSDEAILVASLLEHPEWTDTRRAQELGINRTTIYRYEKYKQAKALLKRGGGNVPRGSKYDGTIEAIDEDS